MSALHRVVFDKDGREVTCCKACDLLIEEDAQATSCRVSGEAYWYHTECEPLVCEGCGCEIDHEDPDGPNEAEAMVVGYNLEARHYVAAPAGMEPKGPSSWWHPDCWAEMPESRDRVQP